VAYLQRRQGTLGLQQLAQGSDLRRCNYIHVSRSAHVLLLLLLLLLLCLSAAALTMMSSAA
jgi:hypothetical protein